MDNLMYSAKHYQAKCAKSEEACKEYAGTAKEYADNAVELTANKADVDLGNVDDNIDYVVESYNDGKNWYKIWKSGWIEQSAFNTGNESWSTKTINLLLPFKNSNYSVLFTRLTDGTSSFTSTTTAQVKMIGAATAVYNKTTTAFGCGSYYDFQWYACGY